MPVIKSARLTLREFEETDEHEVQEYASDPNVCEFMDWGPNSRKETKEFLKRAITHRKEPQRRHFDFAVICNADEKLIGGCGIYIVSETHKTGMVGYTLHAKYWGSGYATEAASELVKFGFEKHKLHRIYATCDVLNTKSAHVLEKLGMRREGEFKEERFIKGKWRTTLLYAILNDEWRAL